MHCLYHSLLFILFLALKNFANAQKPAITVTRFQTLPLDFLYLYFQDSTVVNFDVRGKQVWISENEGKDWKTIEGISAPILHIIPHPFDSRVIFILTNQETHYRTTDRGKTWQTFSVPAPPSLNSEPLTFHSTNNEYVLYQGLVCHKKGRWPGNCRDETFLTTDSFSSDTISIFKNSKYCRFAHSSKDFKHGAPTDLIFCIGTSETNSVMDTRSMKLFSSTDFFKSDKQVVTLPGGNKDGAGVMTLDIVSKFAVVATKSYLPSSQNEIVFFVSTDAQTFERAQFPLAMAPILRENTYTVVESTTHSLGVNVLPYPGSATSTFFVSNSNGTHFVQSLQNTNRNHKGFVEYENIYGMEGVGFANIVDNAIKVDRRGSEKIIKTLATFDDGSSWAPLHAPEKNARGDPIGCDTSHSSTCSLHLHSMTFTSPYNLGRVFSSPALGFILGVGSVGDKLRPYPECDTFLSIDGGASWTMVRTGSHVYAFGDGGSIMVLVDDKEYTDEVLYSTNAGKDWQILSLPIKVHARALTQVPNLTSQKFMLVGTVDRRLRAMGDDKRPHAVIFLDFATLSRPQCSNDDIELWYARNGRGRECVMGRKQRYGRKKPEANCYMGVKFMDPVEHEENCECEDEDYECDFNYVLKDGKCVSQSREPIPANECENPFGTYLGSSGYRLIPGNTCKGGVKKDEKVRKDCSKAKLPPGEISHQTFEFPSSYHQFEYFKDSPTILVRLDDSSVYQSSNEGYTWTHIVPEERFVGFYMHTHSNDRAYLLTTTTTVYYTIDGGKSWKSMQAPLPPSTFGAHVMSFHPQDSDWIIWMGVTGDCNGFAGDCHAEAFYTTNNGHSWNKIETYVKSCGWAHDKNLKFDPQLILCESYKDKRGNQHYFDVDNSLELWEGSGFYKNPTKLFDYVLGFAKFSEYLIVIEFHPEQMSLDLQVSVDGKHFATGMFPSNWSLHNYNYPFACLESSTDSIFLYLTVSDRRYGKYGTILKYNSNGTFFGVSVEQVNRNQQGFVDFEKMIGLNDIALINVITNPQKAGTLVQKKLQTRITHNDGGSWKPLTPPALDSNKAPFNCSSTMCGLHLHGRTERRDRRATFSTSSVPGLIFGIGNVGEYLLPYDECDTFLSRDGGFTWEEVYKGTHLWEICDSGSLMVMANDEQPTNVVLFSTDQGLTWNEYNIEETMQVLSIVTVPSDNSQRVIMFGVYPRSPRMTVAVHVDFSSLIRRQCVLDVTNSVDDDFELWTPSKQREGQYVFGQKTLFRRRIRDRECYVGDQRKEAERLVQNGLLVQ